MNVCGHCGAEIRGGENGMNCHMRAKHGDVAKMGPDFRYYGKVFVREWEATRDDGKDIVGELV